VRIGNLYGADSTFLGIPSADPDRSREWSSATAAIVGAPSMGAPRIVRLSLRATGDSGHRLSSPRRHATESLAGRGPTHRLGVVDLGDVEMPSGETELSSAPTRRARTRRRERRCHSYHPGGTTIALPDVTGVAHHVGWDECR